ncbi:MAG: hypothetical protein M1296_07590 [Chloroflexi bacterium]|nr:hypothetical protein [Chloroflexota bacterium]
MTWQQAWFASSTTGWLAGRSCQAASGAQPSLPPVCTGVILKTTTGGESWQLQYRGPVDIVQLQFAGTADGWALGDEGQGCPNSSCRSVLLRTRDGGGQWSSIATPLRYLSALAFTSPASGWLIGADCAEGQGAAACPLKLLRTDDDGVTWQVVALPATGMVTSLGFSHPSSSDGWVVVTDAVPGAAHLLVSHDAGKGWRVLPDPENGFTQALFFRTSREGWLLIGGQPGAGNQEKKLFFTSNGGESWTERAQTPLLGQQGIRQPGGLLMGGYVGQVFFSTAAQGWIASPRGGLLHSSDGGRHWSAVALDRGRSFEQVHFLNVQLGWALRLRKLWVTRDGGNVWQPVPLP